MVAMALNQVNELMTAISYYFLPLQLIKGDEVILTFACSSVHERDEWTDSFRVLNQLALPCDAGQQTNKPLSGKVISYDIRTLNIIYLSFSFSFLSSPSSFSSPLFLSLSFLQTTSLSPC